MLQFPIFTVAAAMLYGSFAFSQTVNCIVGDPKDQSLVKIFNDEKNPDNGSIRLWRAQRKNPQCDPPVRALQVGGPFRPEILDLEQKIRKNWGAYATINAECVEAAMRGIDSGVMKVRTSDGGTDARICRGENKIEKLRTGSAPCVTEEMSEYLAWILSKGIACFSPDNDPLDARIVFRKLNNESQFGFFVHNRNGSGMHQMVPIATREILAPERGYDKVLQPVAEILSQDISTNPQRQAACEPFREVMERTPPQSLKKPLRLNPCQLLQPGIGVARSVMVGVGNFVHVTHTYFIGQRVGGKIVPRNISAHQLVKNLGFNPLKDQAAKELRDLISLSYYSAAGPAGGKAVYEIAANNLKCGVKSKKTTCTSTAMLKEFKTQMSHYYRRNKQPDYFNKIDQRYKSLLRSMDDEDAPNKYSEEELRGDRCVG